MYRRPPEVANVVTTTKWHSSPIVERATEACKPTDVLRVGGTGSKVGLGLYHACYVTRFGVGFFCCTKMLSIWSTRLRRGLPERNNP